MSSLGSRRSPQEDKRSAAVPVLVTTVALAAFNVGLAVLIVAAIGASTFVPPWLGAAALALGTALAALAVGLWRQFLQRD